MWLDSKHFFSKCHQGSSYMYMYVYIHVCTTVVVLLVICMLFITAHNYDICACTVSCLTTLTYSILRESGDTILCHSLFQDACDFVYVCYLYVLRHICSQFIQENINCTKTCFSKHLRSEQCHILCLSRTFNELDETVLQHGDTYLQ